MRIWPRHTSIVHALQGVRVHGFHPELGAVKQVPAADVVVAFDIPHTQETLMLIFHQVLYCEEVRGGLIPLFQLRSNGIIVNEVPRQHLADPKEDSHSIVADGLIIPLILNGVWSAFQFRKPDLQEFEDIDRHYVIAMTAETDGTHILKFGTNVRTN